MWFVGGNCKILRNIMKNSLRYQIPTSGKNNKCLMCRRWDEVIPEHLVCLLSNSWLRGTLHVPRYLIHLLKSSIQNVSAEWRSNLEVKHVLQTLPMLQWRPSCWLHLSQYRFYCQAGAEKHKTTSLRFHNVWHVKISQSLMAAALR